MKEKILVQIKKAFDSAFSTPADQITIDSVPDDIEGWDSLGHVELGNALEQQFSTSFTIEELMEMEDLKAIVRVIERKVSQTT